MFRCFLYFRVKEDIGDGDGEKVCDLVMIVVRRLCEVVGWCGIVG